MPAPKIQLGLCANLIFACGSGREPGKEGSKTSRFWKRQRTEIVTVYPQARNAEGFPSPAPSVSACTEPRLVCLIRAKDFIAAPRHVTFARTKNRADIMQNPTFRWIFLCFFGIIPWKERNCDAHGKYRRSL